MNKHSIYNLLFWITMAVLWAIMAYDAFLHGKGGMAWLRVALCIGCCIKGAWRFHREKKE